MFRSPTTPSSSPSPDRSHHSSPLRMPPHKSVPDARTGPVGTTKFRLFLLSNQHSPLATIPFRIRTYEKSTRNPFRIRTSKTQDLKSFRMNTSKKTGGGEPPPLSSMPFSSSSRLVTLTRHLAFSAQCALLLGTPCD